MVAKEPCQCGEEKVEYFEHRDRVADLGGLSFALQHKKEVVATDPGADLGVAGIRTPYRALHD